MVTVMVVNVMVVTAMVVNVMLVTVMVVTVMVVGDCPLESSMTVAGQLTLTIAADTSTAHYRPLQTADMLHYNQEAKKLFESFDGSKQNRFINLDPICTIQV